MSSYSVGHHLRIVQDGVQGAMAKVLDSFSDNGGGPLTPEDLLWVLAMLQDAKVSLRWAMDLESGAVPQTSEEVIDAEPENGAAGGKRSQKRRVSNGSKLIDGTLRSMAVRP